MKDTEKIKNKKTKKDLYIFFCILIFSFIILNKYLINHFAADTFYLIKYGYIGYSINYSFLDGRFFMGMIGLIASVFNVPLNIYGNILMFLAITVSCICVIILKNIILKYKNTDSIYSEILLTFISYYTIFHFLYIENLYFLEGFVMALSVLVYILSAKVFVENKNYVKTFILLLIGVELYQGTISMFFILVILFSMLKNKSFREILKAFIISGILFGCCIFLNIIQIRLVEKIFGIYQTRMGLNLLIILSNFVVILYNIINIIINTAKLFPKYLYIFFISIIFFETIYKVNVDYSKKNENKTKEIIIIEQIILILMSILLSFLPSIISLTGFFSGRIRITIGASVGILFIHLFAKTDLNFKKSNINKLLILTIIVFGLLNSINYIYLTNLNYKANKLDKIHIVEIEDYIKNYEKVNNKKIKYISVIPIYNNSNKAFYKELNCSGVGIAVSAIRTNWAVTGIINYYTDLNLTERLYSNEEKEIYLNSVDQRDYLCVDDTIYISSFWN